jgi:hypothetical protein
MTNNKGAMMVKNVLLSRHRKDAKREQAIKQVKEAYAMCEVVNDGQKETKYIYVDEKTLPWRIKMEPEIEDLYSTLDIVKALGIRRERLRDWMNRGFVKPSLPAYGQGTIAIFTFADVLAVKLLDRLIEKGFKRELATEISDLVNQSNLGNVLNSIVLTSVIRDGKPELDVIYNNSGSSFKIEIDENGKISNSNNEEWEDIQIINMVNLYEEVKAELDKLG